ncbi:MAG: hypothetical protein LBI38_05435 [Oscillospiraceae bacterium]|jgi:hypothetical protein|nr:hypothetical protein [Oscillospiraceae bacterium]
MRMKKRLLGAVLAGAMAMSLIPAQAVSAAAVGNVDAWRVYVNVGKQVAVPFTGSVSFSSGKKSVATVSKGVVKGKKSDNVYIKASYFYSATSTSKSERNIQAFVIDSKVPATKVTTAKTSYSITVGDKVQFKYALTPEKNTDMVNVFNGDPDIISISDYTAGYVNVEALKTGTANVTVAASSGVKQNVKITVKANKTDYTTQFGVQVPKKEQTAGKVKISKISLNKYESDEYIYGNAEIKNNHTEAIDYNTKVSVKFSDEKGKAVKPPENRDYWNYLTPSYKIEKSKTGSAYFYVPAGAKTFKFDKADLKPASDYSDTNSAKTLKGTAAQGGIKFPKTSQTVTSKNEDGKAKIQISKVEYKKGDYYATVYVKNTSDRALETPRIGAKYYDGKDKLLYEYNYAYYGNNTLLLPGQTLKAQMYIYLTYSGSETKRVDFTVGDEFRFDYQDYSSVKGTYEIGGVKVPKNGSKITLASGNEVNVSAKPTYKKNVRNAGTGWYYENNFNFKFKLADASGSDYNYVDIKIQYFDGQYVISEYPTAAYLDDLQKKGDTETYGEIYHSRFLKADKVTFEYDRIDFLSSKYPSYY